MQKRIIFSMIFLSLSIITLGQKNNSSSYKSSIGLRAGGGYYDLVAVSFKTFISNHGALELNVGFRPYSSIGYYGYNWFNLSASAAYQHHFDIKRVDGLKWFVGGGVTAFNSFSSYDAYSGFGMGVFPTGGADYKFANIPLNVSVDIRPTIALVKPYHYYSNFYAGNAGASIRYTFR